MECDDAAREIRPAEMIERLVLRPWRQGPDHQIGDGRAAVPLDFDGTWAQGFPAVGVRNRQRQAAISVAVGELVHPLALRTRRHKLRRKFVQRVTGQLHCVPAVTRPPYSQSRTDTDLEPNQNAGHFVCEMARAVVAISAAAEAEAVEVAEVVAEEEAVEPHAAAVGAAARRAAGVVEVVARRAVEEEVVVRHAAGAGAVERPRAAEAVAELLPSGPLAESLPSVLLVALLPSVLPLEQQPSLAVY